MKENDVSQKADVLVEAIPYFLKFRGKTFVFKVGGNIVESDDALDNVCEDIVLLSIVGIKVVLVHGGGKQITELLEKLGIKSSFREGLRLTDDRTMEVVEMVLDGLLNGKIVSKICQKGGKAIGVSGRDFNLLLADAIEGRTGKVKKVNAQFLTKLLDDGFIPVLSSVAVDEKGVSLNTNADDVACEVAVSLKAEKLVYFTDKDGVLDSSGKVLKTLTFSEAEKLIRDGVISGGMIPKVRLALQAVQKGVKKVHIINGFLKHSALLEIFTDEGVGTEIKLD